MNVDSKSSFNPRALEALGISEAEEQAYRVVLTHRQASAEEVANLLSLSPRKAQRLLDSIQFKGLVSHSPSRPRRYAATPPKLAVEALIAQRQAVLEGARRSIPELTEQARLSSGVADREQAVEVISGRAAVGQILMQLMQTVQSEIVGFQRAPMLYIRAVQSEMPRGVVIRSISDAGYLALPGALESLRSDVEKGEQARIFPDLPVKMMVVDRRIGLIPLNTGNEEGTVLLVRSSALLDALYALFNLLWERSTPIVFGSNGELNTSMTTPIVSDALEQVIPLLAAGLNDKTIAHEAGISAATLNRRIASLMKRFDTRTRFQLGWRAAIESFPQHLAEPAREVTLPPVAVVV